MGQLSPYIMLNFHWGAAKSIKWTGHALVNLATNLCVCVYALENEFTNTMNLPPK